MPNKKTRYGRKAVLDHFCGQIEYPFPSAVYQGLFTADPTMFGLLENEVDATSYARMRIDHLLSDASAVSGMITNAQPIVGPNPTEDWPEITHTGIFHAPTAGDMIFHGPALEARVVEQNDPWRCPEGKFTVSALGDATLYQRKAQLDHFFGRVAYPFPTAVWLALFAGDPTIHGSLDHELTHGGYERVNIISLLGDADIATGAIVNTAIIDYPPALEDWPLVSHLGLVDSPEIGEGNITYFGPADAARPTPVGDRFRLNLGQLRIREF